MNETPEVFTSQETLAACYRRVGVMSLIILLVLCVLGFRLWQLQIVDGSRLRTLSEKNRLRLRRLPPMRGLMHDRTGRVVVANRPSFDVVIVPADVQEMPLLLHTLAQYVPDAKELWNGDLPPNLRRPAYEDIVVARDVSRQTLVAIEAHKMDLPGVRIEVSSKRYYPAESVAAHLLGHVGEVNSTEMEQFAGYRLGDLAGKVGLEKAWEEALRGHSGGQQIEIDVSGRKLRVLDEVRAQPGRNLVLTLDLELQEEAERALEEVEGALVVLSVHTGEVLVMANRPAFNPNLFARGIRRSEWRQLLENPLHPLTNRAIQGQYPPGSTFKPIMAAAALEEGVITPETQFRCQGGLPFGGRVFRCWKRSGHGRVDLKQALAQSCDVYFYQIGQRLGIQKIAEYARRFGLGRDIHIALGHAAAGIIPDAVWKRDRFGTPWYAGETLSVVIGQGYVTTTPMQMAVAIAAIANGGTVYRPIFVTQVRGADDTPIQTYPPEIVTQVDIRAEHLQAVREGMWEVVHGKAGTGEKARLMDIEVAGKTGTAQVISGARGSEDDAPRRLRDHAWFVAFAPASDPEVVVVCLMEHAGKAGGAVAAPVVRLVLEAYFRLTRNSGEEGNGIRQAAHRAF